MNPLLVIFYNFCKFLTLVGGWLFYKRRSISGKERLKLKPPVILVSNHPNTLMDPLNVASQVNKIVFFLANASLYKSKFGNWFFSTFYCIKVERPQDVGGTVLKNETAFKETSKFLANGGVFWIAPQGGSKVARHIGKIKTGTARIAFGAEADHDFNLGLRILPIGVNYEAPTQFGKDLFLNIGQEIIVKDYQSQYEKDAFPTVKQLTSDIKTQLENLTIHTIDETEDELISKFETLAFSKGRPEPDVAFSFTKKMIANWRKLQQHAPEKAKKLHNSINTYFSNLVTEQINDAAVGGKKPSFLMLLAGFPMFLYGWLNNIIAASIPLWLVKKINVYKGYSASIKFVPGILSFGFLYLFQCLLVQGIFQNKIITFTYLISLIPAGFFAWHYFQKYKTYKVSKKFDKLIIDKKASLLSQRNAILGICNKDIFPNAKIEGF